MQEELLDTDIKEIRGRQRTNKPGKRIKFNLPNAQNVYLLGILSLVFTLAYFAGIIFAIMAIVRYKKDLPLYHSDPEKYQKSYEKLKKGYVLSWFSIGLSIFFALLIVVLIAANV